MARFDTTLTGNTILFDIDGTLAAAGSSLVSPETIAEVKELAEKNDVYLFSNKRLPARNQAVAALLGVPLIVSPYRKPSLRVLEHVSREKPLVVIGDKVLTDGLLAWRAGAKFMRVSRITAKGESVLDQFYNAVDDVATQSLYHAEMLRVRQWAKNSLVFAPLFFAGQFFNPFALGSAVAAFLVLCLVASAGYIINDVHDAKEDRMHPVKRMRPVAGGTVAPWSALLCAGLLILVALIIICRFVPETLLVVAAYFLSSFFYSIFFKHIPIVEMLFFIWFYLTRLLIGGFAVGVQISAWLMLATVFLALFLVVAKRYAEKSSGRSRDVLAAYPARFLEGMLFMSTMLVLAFYALYSVLGAPSPWAVYSTIPVLAAVMRYLQLTFQNPEAEYPERLLFKDRGLLAAVFIWALFMLVIFY